MNIPEKLKVGGKTYTVGTTDRLVLGSDYGGEIIYTDLEIHLRPMAQEQMEATFLHEMVHAIFDHMGVKNHDEIQVDSLAQAFHMIIKDNPGMFAEAVKPCEDTEPAKDYTDQDVWKALVGIRKKYPAYFERYDVVIQTKEGTMGHPFGGVADFGPIDLRMVEA